MNFPFKLFYLSVFINILLIINFASSQTVTRDKATTGTPPAIDTTTFSPNKIKQDVIPTARTGKILTTKQQQSNDVESINPVKVNLIQINKKSDLICPKEDKAEFQLFPFSCQKDENCAGIGRNYRCCKVFGSKRCLRGIAKPKIEQRHSPFLWVIPRKCPTEPLAELWWELQTCSTDQDCWPRVCCPDGSKRYCRTSQPQFQNITIPVVRQLSYPFEAISGYLQCTPAPPPAFDLYPKTCNNTLDCFPNVCCQEKGKKHCRPPRRSLLALIATTTQNFNPPNLIRQWTENLVIK